jgi:hypothetical protein
MKEYRTAVEIGIIGLERCVLKLRREAEIALAADLLRFILEQDPSDNFAKELLSKLREGRQKLQ